MKYTSKVMSIQYLSKGVLKTYLFFSSAISTGVAESVMQHVEKGQIPMIKESEIQ